MGLADLVIRSPARAVFTGLCKDTCVLQWKNIYTSAVFKKVVGGKTFRLGTPPMR